jgi:hypothetical protein
VATSWFRRLFDRLGARPQTLGASAQADRIEAVWRRRRELESAAALFHALRRAIGTGPLELAAIRQLAGNLRGGFGSEYAARGGHVEEHIAFWRELAERERDREDGDGAAARAFLADCLLAAGRLPEALAEFARAFAVEPTLLHEFGEELLEVTRKAGGAPWLDYRLACLRAAIAMGGDGEDGDEVRELYGELCDEYRGDPTALAGIRAVGREIDQAVARGDLPRALVRRGPR